MTDHHLPTARFGTEPGSSPERTSLAPVLREHRWTAGLVAVVSVVTVILLVQALVGHHSAPRLAATDAPHGAGAAPPAPPTEAPAVTPAAQACRGNTAPQLVKVSLGEQNMWMCRFGDPVASSPVTTGSVDLGDGTPLGTWQIESRETDRYLDGPDYRVFVDYWLPFFEDFGFHDSPWQNFAYGDRSRYKSSGSRGCVHVPEAAMARLYDWSQVGTTVTITG